MATVALFIDLIDMKLPVTRKNTELKMNVNGEIIACRIVCAFLRPAATRVKIVKYKKRSEPRHLPAAVQTAQKKRSRAAPYRIRGASACTFARYTWESFCGRCKLSFQFHIYSHPAH
jgi:hypothetical protein